MNTQTHFNQLQCCIQNVSVSVFFLLNSGTEAAAVAPLVFCCCFGCTLLLPRSTMVLPVRRDEHDINDGDNSNTVRVDKNVNTFWLCFGWLVARVSFFLSLCGSFCAHTFGGMRMQFFYYYSFFCESLMPSSFFWYLPLGRCANS